MLQLPLASKTSIKRQIPKNTYCFVNFLLLYLQFLLLTQQLKSTKKTLWQKLRYASRGDGLDLRQSPNWVTETGLALWQHSTVNRHVFLTSFLFSLETQDDTYLGKMDCGCLLFVFVQVCMSLFVAMCSQEGIWAVSALWLAGLFGFWNHYCSVPFAVLKQKHSERIFHFFLFFFFLEWVVNFLPDHNLVQVFLFRLTEGWKPTRTEIPTWSKGFNSYLTLIGHFIYTYLYLKQKPDGLICKLRPYKIFGNN